MHHLGTRKVQSFLKHLLDSYLAVTGEELVAPGRLDERLTALYTAPFVVLSHNAAPEFGNRLALELWEMSWEEFTSMESNRCAEPMHREDRERFLEEVRARGYADGYSGIRISKSGKRFRIEDVRCWNVMDDTGKRIGQAARYPRFTYL